SSAASTILGQADAAMTALGGAYSDLTTALADLATTTGQVNGDLSVLATDLTNISTAVGNNQHSVNIAWTALQGDLATLAGQLNDLGDTDLLVNLAMPTPDAPGTCASGGPATPLARVADYFALDACTQFSASNNAYDAGSAAYASASTQASALPSGVSAAGAIADTELDGGLVNVTSQLQRLANARLSQAKKLQSVAVTLTKDSAAAQATLDAQTTKLLAQFTTQISADQAMQQRTSTMLVNQVAQVLTQLGGANGHGIFGHISSSALDAGQGASTIGAAADQASNYQGVRQAELAANKLAGAQQQQGLQQATSLPAFAETLPAGSPTPTTAFIFTIPPVG
ncbi:MAG: hypothetical protein FWD74_12100, partial [Actinomycetia bacterium]|nr:hypothetical protein [Actinomycetes bacterium]